MRFKRLHANFILRQFVKSARRGIWRVETHGLQTVWLLAFVLSDSNKCTEAETSATQTGSQERGSGTLDFARRHA